MTLAPSAYVGWAALVSAVALGLALGLGRNAAATRRVFGDFVFRIALPLVVLLGWALAAVSVLVDLPVPLWQALIAGFVIAAGWLTTAIFAELDRARRRAEKLRDFHKAIYAEIGDTLAAYYKDGKAEEYGQALLERMAAEPNFVPFIPRETHDRVYRALLEEIEVLPRQTIDAIVGFYSLVTSIAALADDMRSDRFAALEQDRRMAIYGDYLQMRRNAWDLGQYALALIIAYAQGGPKAAEAKARAVNSPGAGPFHPSPGSE